MTKTQKVLYHMFQENTGKAMCDSGDAYGRHWERNQGKSFEELSALFPVGASIIRPDKGKPWLSLDITKNTLAFLEQNVTLNEEWDKEFHKFAEEHPEDYWYDLQEMFVDYLKEKGHEVNVEGEYLVDMGGNTYNSDNALSQHFQFQSIIIDNDILVFIQVHQGCDIRGGYSSPHLFEVEESTFLYSDVSVHCFGCRDFYADSDNGGYSFCDTSEVNLGLCGGIVVSEDEIEKVCLRNKVWLNNFKKNDFKNLRNLVPYSENLFLDDKESKKSEFELYAKEWSAQAKKEFKDYDMIEGENEVYLPIVDGIAHCPLCGSKLVAY